VQRDRLKTKELKVAAARGDLAIVRELKRVEATILTDTSSMSPDILGFPNTADGKPTADFYLGKWTHLE
jgi:hypothetical protein